MAKLVVVHAEDVVDIMLMLVDDDYDYDSVVREASKYDIEPADVGEVELSYEQYSVLRDLGVSTERPFIG